MLQVVSYSISTSNHNASWQKILAAAVVSYSISTSNHNWDWTNVDCTQLCLILFLHQTTTRPPEHARCRCCVLFYFYIKPQLPGVCTSFWFVVSYSISTSNHNGSVRSSTTALVVSYSISTSNHNSLDYFLLRFELCLILFLHQTTTGADLLW